jgi:hypothetical protein
MKSLLKKYWDFCGKSMPVCLGNVGVSVFYMFVAASIISFQFEKANHHFFEAFLTISFVGWCLTIPIVYCYFNEKINLLVGNKILIFIIKLMIIVLVLIANPLASSSANFIIDHTTYLDGNNFPNARSLITVVEVTVVWSIFMAGALWAGTIAAVVISLFRNNSLGGKVKQGCFGASLSLYIIVLGAGLFIIFCTYEPIMKRLLDRNVAFVSHLIVNLDFTPNHFCKNIHKGSPVRFLDYGIIQGKVLSAIHNNNSDLYTFKLEKCVVED